jgi:DnaD/phage-associated family protein
MTVAKSNYETIEFPEEFISKYMPYAPGEYLKVYLAGLSLSSYKKSLVSEIADILGQRETDVVSALEYWQGKGLLTIKNQEQVWVEFLGKPEAKQSSSYKLYKDKEYNDMLQQLFGTHILKVKEYEMIYDWTEQFGLAKEVCLMVIEYSIERKGRNVNIKYMDAVAKSWAEKRIDSVERASEEIERHERISGGANKILSYLGGYGRLPSKPEMALYMKWTDDWGFTLDSIIMAIEDIGSTTNPSFKYVDSILESFKKEGATTSRKISETRQKQTKTRDDAKELLLLLDMKISKLNLVRIDKFKAMGFSIAAMKIAFFEASKRSSASLNYVEKILESWKEQGLTTKPKIANYLASRKEFQDQAYAFYKKAGITQKLSQNHIKSYFTWVDEVGFSLDMIDEVADYSKTANNPYQYMAKVFSNMEEKGIKTKEGFLDAKKSFVKQKDGKEKDDYMKHDYSPKDFQNILTDIEAEMEDEE